MKYDFTVVYRISECHQANETFSRFPKKKEEEDDDLVDEGITEIDMSSFGRRKGSLLLYADLDREAVPFEPEMIMAKTKKSNFPENQDNGQHGAVLGFQLASPTV